MVSKVNKKFISHLTRAQCTPSAAATVQVPHALPISSLLMLTAGPVSKMASQQEKAFCELHFEVSRSVIAVQREFHAGFRKDAPCRNNITRWYRQFVQTGYLRKGKSPGRPRVSEDNIERVREVFLRSPRKSVARASRELDMPKMAVWKVLRKRLCFKPYKMRLVQALTQADKVKRRDYCEEM